MASTLSEACLVSYQDARCRLHSIGHSLYESPPDVFYGFSSPPFFLFSHFLFSLFVLFLHVQFCKANSRYCISQLVSLQRKFTVSCSLLRYSVNGFISIFINLPLSPSLMPSLPPCFFQKSFPSLWKTSRPTYGGRTGRCATSPYNACDLIVSNSVVFCTLTVIYFPPIPLFFSHLLNYFPLFPP